MKSVYVPGNVFFLLKRFVNVLSTLSISSHYLLQTRRPDYKSTSSSGSATHSPWHSLSTENWAWSHNGQTKEYSALEAHDPIVDKSVPESAFGRKWSLSSLSSLFPYVTEKQISETGSAPPFPPRTPSDQPRKPPPPTFPQQPHQPDIIHQLISNPTLFDPVRTPRYPIVLCHGLYGFDSRGPSSFPSLRMHYWANLLNILRKKIGAEVIVTSVPGTGSVKERSEQLHKQLKRNARGRGVNFLAHSMGGLDCRNLITHIQPHEYVPLSLTSVATPHRGSPFMDWCAENIGLGKIGDSYPAKPSPSALDPSHHKSTNEATSSLGHALTSLPSSVTTLLLSIVDSPAYANLTSDYLNNTFNPATPDNPHVKYYSVAGRMDSVNVWHPFWLPKMVLDGWEQNQRTKERKNWEEYIKGTSLEDKTHTPRWASDREWGNDGLVTVQSAKWGEFLGIMEGCDHWELRGARGIEFGVDLPAIPAIGLGGPAFEEAQKSDNADSWLGEWSSFMGAWRREEKMFHEEAAKAGSPIPVSAAPSPASQPPSSSPFPATTPSEARASASENARGEYAHPREHSQQESRTHAALRAEDDAVVRSSTEKLSAVFDWVMSLPAGVLPPTLSTASSSLFSSSPSSSPPRGSITSSSSANSQSMSVSVSEPSQPTTRRVGSAPTAKSTPGGISRETQQRRLNELATKQDLERFYLALSRKLYDDGL